MQEFVPLEDDWALLENMAEQRLVPYQAGMTCMRRARCVVRPLGPGTMPGVVKGGHRTSWPSDLG